MELHRVIVYTKDGSRQEFKSLESPIITEEGRLVIFTFTETNRLPIPSWYKG